MIDSDCFDPLASSAKNQFDHMSLINHEDESHIGIHYNSGKFLRGHNLESFLLYGAMQ